MEQLDTTTRKVWRVNVRDVAAALGIEVSPFQWVTIEDSADGGPGRRVDVVVWERQNA